MACGDNQLAKDAGRPGGLDGRAIDAPTDAPVLPACANPVVGNGIRFRKLTDLPDFALLVTSPPGDRRLFTVLRRGTIRIFDANEQLVAEPFIDLGDEIVGPVTSTSNEQGLLGLAFHPEYTANGTFFVYYTQLQAPADTLNPYRDVLARCQRSASDPNKADPATCVELFSIPDFAANHNGGMIEFGADGFLYIGTGDGGGSNDPRNNGQALVDIAATNTHALLGKMLRIDVDRPAGGKLYGIPADNPFGNEIFQIGLRNPWRWSFDRENGDMWIGDVGQNAIEEVIHVAASAARGANFGWDMWEGHNCHAPPCTTTGMTFAIDERTHAAAPVGDGWNAVIGGSVYRGTCYPDLVGTYLYANLSGRILVRAKLEANGTFVKTQLVPASGAPPLPAGTSSIHADARGELYLTTTTGAVYHVEGGPP